MAAHDLIITDDELLAYWRLDPSTKRLAQKVGLSRSQVAKRLAALRKAGLLDEAVADVDRVHTQEQLLASVPTEGPGGSSLAQVDVRLWGVAAKNADGELITQGLNGIRARYKVDKASAVVYPPIAPHYHVEAQTYTPLPEPIGSAFQRCFVWGDSQIHFARENGSLVPFHDEAAIDIGLQMLARYRPHHLVIIGDFLDLPGLGRYRKEPAFAYLMNAAIAYATELLAKMRAIVGPDCRISFIPGNHEARLETAILDNLSELYGVKRSCDAFSVLSIPFLLQFERYDVRTADQYPSGEVWLADDLVCRHAPSKDTAATQVCGHKVRATVDSGTLHYHDGPRIYRTHIVPGFGDYHRKPADSFRVQRTNIPSAFGRSGAEQGAATIDITPDGKRHHVQLWDIQNGTAFFREHGLLTGVAEGWEYDERAA